MPGQFTAPTTYFLEEGRENLPECLKIAFHAAKQQNIGKILIFTARGEGVRMALDNFCSQPDFKHIKLVAVTFPEGKHFTDGEKPIIVEIPADQRMFFENRGVSVVKAHSPFDPITSPGRQRGVLGQDLSLVGDALDVICGSMSLCVQAILLACDAGAVTIREHVIALTSDTAVLAQAASTARMLSDLVIREILCKPAILTVSRKEIADKLPVQLELGAGEEKRLGAEGATTPKIESGTDPNAIKS
jgi:hypothetical protein